MIDFDSLENELAQAIHDMTYGHGDWAEWTKYENQMDPDEIPEYVIETKQAAKACIEVVRNAMSKEER